MEGRPSDATATKSSCCSPSSVLSTIKMHEGIVPEGLLDKSSVFLKTLLDEATTGKRQVMGRTLLDPKKDSKWERGRTRQALHFGAHVRGGKAVGAEVEDIPSCLVDVLVLLRAAGVLAASSQRAAAAAAAVADGPSRREAASREADNEEQLVAVTVDFFRKRSYAPALAATAPMMPLDTLPTSARDTAIARAEGDASNRSSPHAGFTRPGPAGRGGSDTDAGVCMLWLQPDGEVVVGSPEELAKCSKGHVEISGSNGGETKGPHAGGAEGVFVGLERLSAPRGAVMVWDSAQAQGLQMAVPTAARDRVLVSFQTLTPEASSHVLRNRLERQKARAAAGDARRAAKEAKEAKAKGPIPGTPIVVENWRESGEEEADGTGIASGISGGKVGKGGIDDGKTPSIEREHVQAVYDTIAPHWSHTRYKPWPRVEEFLSQLEAFSLIADAGCGNGKYLGCEAAGGWLIGSDASVNLLQVCKERMPKAEVLGSDCMRLPYRSGMFDAAISIAVLHHFSSEARRLRALSELCRVLKPGGRVLVYAWAIEQEQDSRRSFAAQDVLVPWHLADHHNQDPHGTGDRGTSEASVQERGTGEAVPTPQSTNPGTVRGQTEPNLPPPPPSSEHNLQNTSAGHCAVAGVPSVDLKTVASCKDEDGRRKQAVCGGRSASHLGGGTGDRPGSEDDHVIGPRADCIPAPTPKAPRHGVRLDAVAGTGGSVVYQRYCHVYVEGELEQLVGRVDGLNVVDSYYDRSNWCVVAERVM